MIHLSPLDSILVLAYFAAVIFIGFRASRKGSGDSADFLLAGRTLTLPMFVATLVSTWYGGILGVGEFSYKYGLANWLVFGVPYYFFAAVFAVFLAEKVRGTNLTTIPDKLEQAYDRKTAIVGGVLTFFLVTPAAYVLMLGVLVQLMFGLDLLTSILLTTLCTIVYLYSGGFRSDVWANTFEFVMMFLGFILMVLFAYAKFGGFSFIQSNVPALHLTWNGGNTWQFVLVWFFIALWTLVDPAFHQRCYAAKDGATARRGILLSILFWMCFDFLTTTSGLYARAALPNLDNPTFSYPLLAEMTLPVVAKGFFYIGLLATIMSTLSSLTLISGITVGKDIVGRWMRQADDSALVRRWTGIGLIFTAIVSVVLALLLPSVVRIWYTVGTCIIPALLVPILASYFPQLLIRARYAFLAMMAGWVISTGSLATGMWTAVDGIPHYWWGLEPMYPGLFAAGMFWAIGRLEIARQHQTPV
ncbi:MAG: sodium:solute symporter family protein [Bacteroidota bacterium]